MSHQFLMAGTARMPRVAPTPKFRPTDATYTAGVSVVLHAGKCDDVDLIAVHVSETSTKCTLECGMKTAPKTECFETSSPLWIDAA